MKSKTLNQRGLFLGGFIRRWKIAVFIIVAVLLLSPINSAALEINASHGKGPNDVLNAPEKNTKTLDLSDRIDFTNILNKWSSKGFLPGFYVYTNLNGHIKRTKMALGLTRPIDIDDDGKNDVSVRPRIRPKFVFDPLPSIALSLDMKVNRLNDDIKYGELEIAGEVSLPNIIGGRSIRFGYLSELGQEIPRSCSLSYLYIPHIFKLRKKPAGGIEFDPISAEESSIIVLATVENPVNDTTTTVGIRYDPMVRSVINWERTRKIGEWKFSISRKLPRIRETTATLFLESDGMYAGLIIDKLSSASFELKLRPLSRYGGYLHYVKENLQAADVSLLIQTINLTGTLSIDNIPSEIEASWLLRPKGFVEINTHGGTTGEITATIRNHSSLSFDPETNLDLKVAWSNITKNSLNLDINSNIKVNIRDIYIYKLSYNNSTGIYESFPVLENGNLNLLGKFGLKSHLILPEISKGIIMNSTVKILIEDASLDFIADNLSGMGRAAVSLFNTGRAEIDLLNFKMDNSTVIPEEQWDELPEDYLMKPWEYAPWMNGTVFIDTNGGHLTLSLLDIESFGDFGHTIIKNLTGSGQTKVEFHLISMYLGNPLLVTNGLGTNITLDEFSFRFFDMPITIYDAKLVEGVFNFYFEMWSDHWITAEIRDGSGIEKAGISIEPLGRIPEIDEANFKLHFYLNEPINYLYFDWYVYDYINPLHSSFVLDTHGIDTHLDMYITVFDKYGIKFDNLTLNAVETNLTINLKDIDLSDPSSIISALSNITLTGNLTILNFGKTIEIMINGTWYPLIQSGEGYNITVEHGHIQIVGNKRFILNETLTIPNTDIDVTIAGDFSLGSEAGVIDIWLNSTGIRISGNVNFTVRDFYLAIGDNFSISADLFVFNLGTEAQGSIEIGPTPSGTGKISLTKTTIRLENATIIFRGPIPIPNTPPEVNIISPSDGSEVNGVVTIEGNATDPDGEVIQVEVSIDGGEWINASYSDITTEWTYEWNTSEIPNGVYTIEARAFDGIDYSEIARINVTVSNPGANWRPEVKILHPNDGDKVNGTIVIEGVARDPDGNIVLVQIQIDDGPWNNATGTTSWSYQWNTTGLIGRHTIKARAVDNKGEYSSIDSVEVKTVISIEVAGALELSLRDASIDVKNLTVKVEITGAVILSDSNPEITIKLNRFSLGGVGNVSLSLSPDGVAIQTGGTGRGIYSTLDMALDATIPSAEGDFVLDTSISTTGRVTGPLSFYYNSTGVLLAGDFGFDRKLDLHVNKLSGVINATPISVEIHISLIVNLSTHGFVSVEWNESGLQKIYADFDSDMYGYIRIYDVHVTFADYSGGVDNLMIRGNGGLSIKGNTFSFEGGLGDLDIDNLYLRMPGQNISLSGGLSTSRYLNLSVTVNGITDFILSSDGSFYATDVHLSVETDNTSASLYVGRIGFSTESYLSFKYINNGLNVTCRVHAHRISADDVTISYGNHSLHLDTINFEGTVDLTLDSPIYVEKGEDHIRIVVGGNGQADLHLDTLLSVNGKQLGVEGHLRLKNGRDNFTIFIGNLSGNTTLDIDGSAVVSIDNFHLWYGNMIDIDIPSLSASFMLSGTENGGTMNITGVSMVNIDANVSINRNNLSISGIISFQGGIDGNILVSWNETGITQLEGEASGDITSYIHIENLHASFKNFTVSAERLYINGTLSIYFFKKGDQIKSHLETTENATLINAHLEFIYNGNLYILNINRLTFSGSIYLTLQFSGSTASMLSSSYEDKYSDPFMKFIERLIEFVRRW